MRVADRLRAWGNDIAVQDVVVWSGSATWVAVCALDVGVVTSLVQPLHRTQAVSEHCDARQLHTELVAATDVTHALAWRRRHDGSFMVVRK